MARKVGCCICACVRCHALKGDVIDPNTLRNYYSYRFSFRQHNPWMYKYLKYAGCVTFSMKSNEEMGHPQGDTDIPELSYRHHEKIAMVRNRHPAAIYHPPPPPPPPPVCKECFAFIFTPPPPPVCKECFAFIRFDCRSPFQLICKPCGPNMANVCCLYTEKFALLVAYRETRPPFWDALISRYQRPMTNVAIVCSDI